MASHAACEVAQLAVGPTVRVVKRESESLKGHLLWSCEKPLAPAKPYLGRRQQGFDVAHRRLDEPVEALRPDHMSNARATC